MAVNIEIVAEKVFNLLAGNGYDISNLNSQGEKVVDPQEATRFVVVDPNILVRLDKGSETLSMGVRETFEDDGLRDAFKHLAGDYLMNFDYRIFGKTLKPKSETIDIAKKSEKKMGDVLEALNTMRNLAGLAPLSEADVINEFQEIEPWVEDLAYEHLNGEFRQHPIEQLMKPKGREYLIRSLYNHDGHIKDYNMSTQIVDEFLRVMKRDMGMPESKNLDEERDWWQDWDGSQGYDAMYSSWRNHTQDEYRDWGQETPYNDEEMEQEFQKGLVRKGYNVKKLKKITAKLKAKRVADDPVNKWLKIPEVPQKSEFGKEFDRKVAMQSRPAESIGEGFSAMSGSSKTSYQGLDSVKLIVRHKKEVNEETRGARSRNIHSIFIQRGDERFKMAENNLKAARAMARHVKNGGEPFDNIGHTINEMATEQRKLREFVRYVKRAKLVNEENESYVNIAMENINYITTAFTKLAGVRSYATAVEDVSDRRNTEVLEDDIDLESKFTETHFDNKVASVVDSIKSAMSRKSSFENYIDKSVSLESFTTLKNVLSENDGMEFATPHAKLGYQVSQMSTSVSDSRLGNYLSGISKKLYSGDRMSQHEYTTIKSCLLGAHKRHEVPTSVAESVEDQYEKFIEQFDIL